MSDGGKGSAPRKQQDYEAYSKNWDTIFGKKDALLQSLVDENERMGLYDQKEDQQFCQSNDKKQRVREHAASLNLV